METRTDVLNAVQISIGLATALTFDDVLLVPQHSQVLPSAVDVATPNGDFADFYCANNVTIDHNTMVCHSTHGKCVQSQFLYQFPWGAPACTSNGGPDLGNARFQNWRVYGNIAYDLLTDRSVGWEIQGLHTSQGEPSNDPHETLLQSDYNAFFGLRPGHGIGTNRWGVCGGSGFDGAPGTMCLSEFPEQFGGQCHFDGVDGHEVTCLYDGIGRTEIGYDPTRSLHGEEHYSYPEGPLEEGERLEGETVVA